MGTVSIAKISNHERAALGEDLEGVPVGGLHRVEYGIDKMPRHFLVKEVAHRIDEDASRLSPTQRLF